MSVWKVLEEIIMEFRKKGLTIPQKTMNDLKSAKVMIAIMDVDKGFGETAQKIDLYLGSVESYLITAAQKTFASTLIDKWLKRLEEAQNDNCEIEKKEETKIISGVPRDQKWIRIKPTFNMPLKKIKKLAEETSLSSRVQGDGRLVVYGKSEDIKKLIKKITVLPNKD